MIAYIKNKIAGKTGFSLTELLTTTLILSLVTATIASSIPGAIRAYRTVVDVANANILLTSTITKLRSELTGASKIKVYNNGKTVDRNKKNTVDYTNGKGVLCRIEFVESNDKAKGIYYYEFKCDENGRAEPDPPGGYLLVSQEAASKKMYVKGSVEKDPNGDYLQFIGLSVLEDDRDSTKDDRDITKSNITFTVRLLSPKA